MARNKNIDSTEDRKGLSGPSFWTMVLDLLLGVDKVDKRTKERLNSISKQIQKSEFSNYFNTFTAKASADFARFFYDVYRMTSSVQMFFNNSFNLEKSYNRIFREAMSSRQLEILDLLAEDAILEKSRNVKYVELQKEVKALIGEFHKEFTSARTDTINSIYNSLFILRSFCAYDYYALLRLFSNDIRELDFSKKPHFYRVWGVYLVEKVADFDSLLKAFLTVKDWNPVFEFVNTMAGKQVINIGEWSNLVLKLQAHEELPIFEMVCQLVNKNPDFAIKASTQRRNIVALYVREVDERTVSIMQAIYKEQRSAVIRSDVKKMFPNGFKNSLKNYVSDMNDVFATKGLTGYEHCDALSYLYAFVEKYIKEEVEPLASELNVYGKVLNKDFIVELLECSKKLMGYIDAINAFDGKLNPQLAQGFRFVNFLSQKIVSEQEMTNTRTQLDLVNAEALKMLNGAFVLSTELGNMMSELSRDCQRDTRTILSNWNELENRASVPYKQKFASLVQAIAQFQKLEKNFIGNVTSAS